MAKTAKIRSFGTFYLVLALVGLLVLVLCAFVFAISLGPVEISFGKIVNHLLSYLGITTSALAEDLEAVIETARAPRAVMALLIGASLGVGGVVMQSIFRNPLAEPGVVGISSGAALAATSAIAFGFGTAFPYLLPLVAFLGAIAAIILITVIAGWSGNSLTSLILTGLALNALISALITLILLSVGSFFVQRQILFWLAGGLDLSSWGNLGYAIVPIAVGLTIVAYFTRDLNTMLLGKDEALALGTRVGLVRPLLLFATALIVGAAVAFSGVIAFVGIIIPHLVRMFVGHDHRVVLPFAVVSGALFLLLADTLARTVIAPSELRVGIVTGLLGAPFFLLVLIRHRAVLKEE